ncbi:MtnX-like HAD-IB family phosphatase [Bacillus haynesii]|uniref:MtnX-like HAD-IB family phosphatase n=1 Tax=Bacillus haynesii TaxID=1925021 RepID=A0AA90E2I4_9BACI|nr:MtnX-like HAD-IB family phosphatase [Bacillus haynesii]MCY7752050.1 MtnX-like HAD-IB family phosphatase [Bacillus haynesii]MCY7789425.1 MtnX-like HAD-IB family phosphatase [Bacillus haynesii]MCY8004398.1 MtnX-like HAD-IB family phosphatase [Bacillus haynesii]MCY8382578.1 MtnX-like HAD-IB family phosphatase [Bacillus haynesii]MCY8587027.1 MtnX-like HAD-IB family phosphatase [Bacillus haynesii]
MKKWAFVSDFDGTISKQDFYWMVIDKYFPEGRELFKKWKSGELKDIEFLGTVFASINQSEQKIIDDIHSIPIDEYVPDFIQHVQKNGGDFYILSAGTDYYIHYILKKYGITDVEVYSNKGFFKEDNVHMDIDENHWHYSERYGIDKSKVIQKLKEKYETIYFAGDSEPDSHPAKFADVTFAKDALQDLLRQQEVPFVAVETFEDIEQYLKEKGWIV